jgi:sec-independent protein translocase protein TatC
MTLPDEDCEGGGLRKSFLGHLEDLRAALLWSSLSLVVGMLIAIPLTPWVVEVLKRPLLQTGMNPDTFLRALRVTSGLSVTMRTVFWGGCLLGMPGMVWAMGRFIVPGLTRREVRVSGRAVLVAGCLFVSGVLMGYFMTLPIALGMMFRINSWLGVASDFVELCDYIGFALKLLLAFGLVFELPVVVMVLGACGLVDAQILKRSRPYVVVGIMIVSMFLTPPDPLTLFLMSIPMWLLYEACILLIGAYERRQRAHA